MDRDASHVRVEVSLWRNAERDIPGAGPGSSRLGPDHAVSSIRGPVSGRGGDAGPRGAGAMAIETESTEARLSVLLLRWEELKEGGQAITAEDLCRDHPDLADELRRRIEALDAMKPLLSGGRATEQAPRTVTFEAMARDHRVKPKRADATCSASFRELRFHAE